MILESIISAVSLFIVGAGILWRQSGLQAKNQLLIAQLTSNVDALLKFEKKSIERWTDHEVRIRHVEGRNGTYPAEDA